MSYLQLAKKHTRIDYSLTPSLLQMTDIYLPLLVGATVYFAQPDALNVS